MGTLIKQLAVGLTCGLVAIFFALTPAVEMVELKIYDLLHILRPLRPASDSIVLVAIDESSFAELGLQWPWPRSIHARLTTALSKAGAAAIGFDILFPESSSPEEDRTFAEAIQRARMVVLASSVSITKDAHFDRQAAIDPLPDLKQHARTGRVSLLFDRDNIIRKVPRAPSSEQLFGEALVGAAGLPAIVPPNDAYIAFRSPPNSYPTVFYHQALEPDQFFNNDLFRGKIVIVGKSTAPSVEARPGEADYFGTPLLFLTKHLMSGIEVHANIVHGFLTGDYVVRLGSAESAALVLLVGALAGLLQLRWQPLRSALLAGAAIVGLSGLALLLFEHGSYWVPLFSLTFPLGLSYIVGGADAYLRAERKRQEIKRAFAHYVPPAVLEGILADPSKLRLGGVKVEATILFSDIAGFTTISERHTPEVISKLLNRYMTAMTRIITSHNGTVDKFIGDGIMAFWGAPLEDPEHALNACRAALAMRDRLPLLNCDLRELGLPAVSFRIGINLGEVIVGNMGSEELFDYTVIGDAVNLASRLEGANRQFGTEILISSFLYKRVRERVEAKPLGTISVKGKAKAVEVFALQGLQ